MDSLTSFCICAVVVMATNTVPTALATFIELNTNSNHSYISLEELGAGILPGQTSFRFQVRARHDAHVALLQSGGDINNNMYEIIIGGWNNRKSVIRNSHRGVIRVEVNHTPLDSSGYRHFWIKWDNGMVSVGSGMVVGLAQFMRWIDPVPHDVNYIAVSTGWGSNGWWKFEDVRVYGLVTEDNYFYRPVPGTFTSNVTFSVKASNDAHIALLSNEGDYNNNMYEIVIGGWRNTQSVIREGKQGTNLAYAKHNPLSPRKHVPFWISFDGGVVSVGYGSVVGRRRFMSWRYTTPSTINLVSVATGWGATGHWLI